MFGSAVTLLTMFRSWEVVASAVRSREKDDRFVAKRYDPSFRRYVGTYPEVPEPDVDVPNRDAWPCIQAWSTGGDVVRQWT